MPTVVGAAGDAVTVALGHTAVVSGKVSGVWFFSTQVSAQLKHALLLCTVLYVQRHARGFKLQGFNAPISCIRM